MCISGRVRVYQAWDLEFNPRYCKKQKKPKNIKPEITAVIFFLFPISP
jgi:hypothetical protein